MEMFTGLSALPGWWGQRGCASFNVELPLGSPWDLSSCRPQSHCSWWLGGKSPIAPKLPCLALTWQGTGVPSHGTQETGLLLSLWGQLRRCLPGPVHLPLEAEGPMRASSARQDGGSRGDCLGCWPEWWSPVTGSYGQGGWGRPCGLGCGCVLDNNYRNGVGAGRRRRVCMPPINRYFGPPAHTPGHLE